MWIQAHGLGMIPLTGNSTKHRDPKPPILAPTEELLEAHLIENLYLLVLILTNEQIVQTQIFLGKVRSKVITTTESYGLEFSNFHGLGVNIPLMNFEN